MLAVIEVKGKQYKVEENSVITTDKIDTEEGKEITIKTVLLKQDKNVEIGKPFLDNSEVKLKVVKQGKGKKIRVFKMIPKERYHRTKGFRGEFTKLQVLSIK